MPFSRGPTPGTRRHREASARPASNLPDGGPHLGSRGSTSSRSARRNVALVLRSCAPRPVSGRARGVDVPGRRGRRGPERDRRASPASTDPLPRGEIVTAPAPGRYDPAGHLCDPRGGSCSGSGGVATVSSGRRSLARCSPARGRLRGRIDGVSRSNHGSFPARCPVRVRSLVGLRALCRNPGRCGRA